MKPYSILLYSSETQMPIADKPYAMTKRKGGPTRINWESFIGQKFGRLTVLGITGRDKKYAPLADAKCECGVIKNYHLGSIRKGDVLSCGCLVRDMLKLPTHLRLKVARRPSRPQTWEKKKKWVENNRSKMKAVGKRFRQNHKAQVKAEKAAYYQKAKPKIYAKLKHRFATDLRFRIEGLFRSRVRKALRIQKAIKSKRMLALLGCTLDEFKAHLESLFTDGMSWELVKSGDIQIDHKTPLRAFDLRDPAQQLVAFNFKNNQPLWKIDNLSKSDTLPCGRRARDVMPLPPEPTSNTLAHLASESLPSHQSPLQKMGERLASFPTPAASPTVQAFLPFPA